MDIKSKVEKLENRANHKSIRKGAKDMRFSDYMKKVLNSPDKELTEGEFIIKRKNADFEKKEREIKDLSELRKILGSTEFEGFEEGLLEILRKVKHGETFEAGRDKKIREKLNEEFRKAMSIKRSLKRLDNAQTMLKSIK
jgi:hypothetical protein